MNRSRLVILIAMFALWPSLASAQIGYVWEWLEQMSGPGPWNIYNGEVRLWCEKQPAGVSAYTRPSTAKVTDCWRDTDPDIRSYFDVRAGGGYTNGIKADNDVPRFVDVPSVTDPVYAVKLEGFWLVRLTPAIDAGGGLGWMRFWGDGMKTFDRFVSTPISVSITPGAFLRPDTRNSRWVKIRYETHYFPKGFKPEDFGASSSVVKYRRPSDWSHAFVLAIEYSK